MALLNPQKKRLIYFFTGILVITMTGCVSSPSKNYKKEMVDRYAELSLLYEKEKMINKRSDSVYQILVQDFFREQNVTEEEFQQSVNTLASDPMTWKFFIQDVSSAIDTLKMKGNGS